MRRKIHQFTIGGLVLSAVQGLCALPASADITTLLCDTGNANNGPVTMGIDKDAGKVTLTFSPMRNLPQIPVRPPATLNATFDVNTVRFSENPDGRSMDYSINRSTGNVDVTETNGGQTFHYSWTCQVSKPQF